MAKKQEQPAQDEQAPAVDDAATVEHSERVLQAMHERAVRISKEMDVRGE
jgi:hypothetical protein